MTDREFEFVNLGDHNLSPWEAEVRARHEQVARGAVEKLRAEGEPHPVLVVGRRDVLNLGEPTVLGPSSGLVSWVISRQRAIAATKGSMKRFLREQFQCPVWPVSYFTVALYDNGVVECCESRFFSDCSEEDRRQAGLR